MAVRVRVDELRPQFPSLGEIIVAENDGSDMPAKKEGGSADNLFVLSVSKA